LKRKFSPEGATETAALVVYGERLGAGFEVRLEFSPLSTSVHNLGNLRDIGVDQQLTSNALPTEGH